MSFHKLKHIRGISSVLKLTKESLNETTFDLQLLSVANTSLRRITMLVTFDYVFINDTVLKLFTVHVSVFRWLLKSNADDFIKEN